MATRGLSRNTALVADTVRQGWHKDPFGLHEARYFSAGSPTKLVRDGSVEGYDEPPPGDYEWADTAADASEPGVRAAAAHTPDLPAAYPRRSRAGMLSAVVMVTAAAVAAGVLIASGTAHNTPMSPSAFVTQSAHRTVAAGTAHITIAGTISAGTRRVTMHGTGQADFATGAAALSLGYSAGGNSFTLNEIAVKGNLYLSVGVNGKIPVKLADGRHWIHISVRTSKTDLAGSNPSDLLSALEKSGNKVRQLGTKVIGDMSCTGYSVTADKQSMTVWFNEQGLLCRMGVQLE